MKIRRRPAKFVLAKMVDVLRLFYPTPEFLLHEPISVNPMSILVAHMAGQMKAEISLLIDVHAVWDTRFTGHNGVLLYAPFASIFSISCLCAKNLPGTFTFCPRHLWIVRSIAS